MSYRKRSRRKKFLEYLKSKYRLVVMNDETFEEVTSFRLSRMNVYALISTLVILITLIVTVVIFFTPIREYIPGYGDVNMRKQLVSIQLKTDSIEHALALREQYIRNLKNVMSGNIDTTANTKEVSAKFYDTIELGQITAEDSLLRAEMENKEQWTLEVPPSRAAGDKSEIAENYFFPPLKGFITSDFDFETEHYGIDIVAPENEPVKAVLDGTVISSSWTMDTGHVIAVQHSNNLISFYKHNSVLLKKVGNFVRAGDAIAIIGSTGELTTGPHLHFELWHNGVPVDPEEYIVF